MKDILIVSVKRLNRYEQMINPMLWFIFSDPDITEIHIL